VLWVRNDQRRKQCRAKLPRHHHRGRGLSQAKRLQDPKRKEAKRLQEHLLQKVVAAGSTDMEGTPVTAGVATEDTMVGVAEILAADLPQVP
jgi:hypothetical protein